jgi:transposase
MLVKAMQFEATAMRVARDRVIVPVPFDPDEVWGAKPRHHVAGSVNGIRVRAVIEPVSSTGFDGGNQAWRTAMVAPRKYPQELRERSIRLALDARKDPASRPGACRRIGEQLGINPETLRGWVTQAEVDQGARPGTTSSDAARLVELERENRELRRTNAILRSASSFFAAELDRPSR